MQNKTFILFICYYSTLKGILFYQCNLQQIVLHQKRDKIIQKKAFFNVKDLEKQNRISFSSEFDMRTQKLPFFFWYLKHKTLRH